MLLTFLIILGVWLIGAALCAWFMIRRNLWNIHALPFVLAWPYFFGWPILCKLLARLCGW